ncbi:MAG: diguanylate cyclase [Gaiellaceae bacterium]
MATGMTLYLQTTTWIAVGAAVGAAAIALVVAIVLLALVLRSRRGRRDPDVERLLQESDARFEQMLEELSRELARAREESQRSQRLASLGGSIDLDVVARQVVEAALELTPAEAAIVVISQPEDEPVVVTAGMTPEEAERQPVGGRPDSGGETRAITINYRYAEESAGDETLIRGGLVIPLMTSREPIGSLAVFWRGRERQLSEQELRELEELAAAAAPVIVNARRFREARQLADLDALTSLHNRRYFHDALARECARATRYERSLALLVFDIDDFKSVNDQEGHLGGDHVLAQLGDRVQSVIRSSDVGCRIGGDEFAVILPESALVDAEQLFRRLQFAVANRSTGPAERLRISAGVAELRPNDDPISFFERADDALYRAKQGGKGRAIAGNDAS